MRDVLVDTARRSCFHSDDIRCDRPNATRCLGGHQSRKHGTADHVIPDTALYRGPTTGDAGDPDGRREFFGDSSVKYVVLPPEVARALGRTGEHSVS